MSNKRKVKLTMGKKLKIAVALSGGVDSSVVAALMKDQYGKENVIGLTLKLFCDNKVSREKNCCSLDSIDDARAVCHKLGLAHYLIKAEKEFEKTVIDNFIKEYHEGRTPNPCLRCNKLIKFDYFLRKAKECGADLLATGHYAQIEKTDQEFRLLKGEDEKKDQSYFLYNLNQGQLCNILFPLGKMTKTEVRERAKKANLVTAEKAESQDICFIPNSVEEFLKSKLKQQPGLIVNSTGDILGRHQGLAFYTLGQRKGLGGGFKEPLFVIGSNREKNELIIGPERKLYKDELLLEKISWVSGHKPKLPLACRARIRYQAEETACHLDGRNKQMVVQLKKAQRAITPGQSVVFYKGKVVLGGGIIER